MLCYKMTKSLNVKRIGGKCVFKDWMKMKIQSQKNIIIMNEENSLKLGQVLTIAVRNAAHLHR